VIVLKTLCVFVDKLFIILYNEKREIPQLNICAAAGGADMYTTVVLSAMQNKKEKL
jgi:hypothetical protein